MRKRSCPAVSQICSFTHFPSISTFLILKSMLQADEEREPHQREQRAGASASAGDLPAATAGAASPLQH